MKRFLFWSAVTMIAAVSCNKFENETPLQKSNVPSFEAYVDGAEAKTVIDGMKSYWNGTEGIRVLDGVLTNGKVYTATASKAESATFVEKNSVALTGDDYLAVYPESPAGSVTWDGNIANPAKKFWLSGNQIAENGTYDPSTHIAVAYTEAGNENLEFKNVTSLVKFTLQSDNVTEVCFYGNNSDIISGNFDVNYNSGEPTYTTTGTGYTKNAYAKITAKSGTLTKGATYYISVLPCDFGKGFSIETIAYNAAGTLKNSNEYTLERNQILDLGNITWNPDKDADFYFELDTDNLKNWFSPAYLYVWTDAPEIEPLGTWPGKQMTKVNSTTYSIKIPKEYIGKKLYFIVNNKQGWKTGDQTMKTVYGSQTYKGTQIGLS